MNAPAVDLTLPGDGQLMSAAAPNPRVEAERLTETGKPERVADLGRRLQQAGAELDRLHEQSWQAPRILAGAFANNGAPVYDRIAHRELLPAGFADGGTQLHDVGRRVGVVAEELGAAIVDLNRSLNQLQSDLNRSRAAFGAEVAAARGTDGLIPLELVGPLQARRTSVAAQMQEQVNACGRTVTARVGRYSEVLNDCRRLLGDFGPVGPVGPMDTSGTRLSPLLGGQYEGGISGFTAPTPQGPSIIADPVPPPLPREPGFTPLPVGPGPLINVPAPDLGAGRQDGPGSGQRQFRPPVTVDSQRPSRRSQPPTGPIPAPQALPGFPDARQGKRKTPVQGGGNRRPRWDLPKGGILEWDYRHGEVEKYDKRGHHLGSFDPNTGKQLKPADPTRKIEPQCGSSSPSPSRPTSIFTTQASITWPHTRLSAY